MNRGRFDFGNSFADLFQDFASSAGGGAPAGQRVLAGEIPPVRVCSTHRELADWFTQFARACRANLPREAGAS